MVILNGRLWLVILVQVTSLTLDSPTSDFVFGIRFIVLYPPKCSHNLPPLAGLNTRKPFQSPRDIPEQLAAYSTQALSTAFLMLGTQFAAG